MTETINRTDVSRALAKAIAYKDCGQDRKAELWAMRLVDLLHCADIISDDARRYLRQTAEG